MNTFTLLLISGTSLGFWRVHQVSQKKERDSRMVDAIWIMLGALPGARLAFVIAHANYFHLHPDKILAFWEGGLAWPGALMGTIITLILISFYRSMNLSILADKMAVLILPVSTSLWLGGWASGVAYGALLPEGTWYGINTIDAFGRMELRFPLQAIMAAGMVLGSALAEHITRGKSAGVYSLGQFTVLTLLLLITSILRADPQPMWVDWPVETWIAAILLITSLISLLIHLKRSADKPDQVE